VPPRPSGHHPWAQAADTYAWDLNNPFFMFSGDVKGKIVEKVRCMPGRKQCPRLDCPQVQPSTPGTTPAHTLGASDLQEGPPTFLSPPPPTPHPHAGHH
jgi:hypothetical protein